MGLKTGIELLKTKMGKAKDFYQSTKSMNTINNINVSIPDGGIKTEEFSFDEQYTVQKGDTLGKIAASHGLSYQELADYNGIADPNKIDVGQKILIPDVETIPQVDQSYIVQKGDTLGKIANQYGLSYQDLADYNGIADPNKIDVGQEILIPDVETRSQVDQSYIVQKGDTLTKIANQYGLTYQELANYNGIADPNNIEVGWKIQLPEEETTDSKKRDKTITKVDHVNTADDMRKEQFEIRDKNRDKTNDQSSTKVLTGNLTVDAVSSSSALEFKDENGNKYKIEKAEQLEDGTILYTLKDENGKIIEIQGVYIDGITFSISDKETIDIETNKKNMIQWNGQECEVKVQEQEDGSKVLIVNVTTGDGTQREVPFQMNDGFSEEYLNGTYSIEELTSQGLMVVQSDSSSITKKEEMPQSIQGITHDLKEEIKREAKEKDDFLIKRAQDLEKERQRQEAKEKDDFLIKRAQDLEKARQRQEAKEKDDFLIKRVQDLEKARQRQEAKEKDDRLIKKLRDEEASKLKKEDIIYTVKSGDTLSSLSVKYGISVDDIVKYNNAHVTEEKYIITDPSAIDVGDVIVIPQTSDPVLLKKELTPSEMKRLEKMNPVERAKVLYEDEYKTAIRKYSSDSSFMTFSSVPGFGSDVRLMHIVLKDPGKQLQYIVANGEYATGTEQISSMATRNKDIIAIVNGSHFDNAVGTGRQDLARSKGLNRVAIADLNGDGVGELLDTYSYGKVTDENRDYALNETAGGMEIVVYNDGRIGTAPAGATAQQLIDSGVIMSFTSFEEHHLENGNERHGDEWEKGYSRTYIAMKEPGEYYIMTGDSQPCMMIPYLESLGCTFAKSFDQGGSVSVSIEGETEVSGDTDYANNERPIGDAFGFKDL